MTSPRSIVLYLSLFLRGRLAVLAMAVALAACATPPPSSPTAPTVTPPTAITPTQDAKPAPKAAPTPPPTPLATEQRYLEEWFRGTPVAITPQGPATLLVDVPLANSFDSGKADIKPALNAVLDRVANSLRRQIGARIAIAAPADANGSAALATTRAQKVREALVTKRVAAPRIVLAEAARAGAPLQLRLTIPAPAIARLDDATLPVPVNGIKPVVANRAPIAEKR